jgi:hypothetical protein
MYYVIDYIKIAALKMEILCSPQRLYLPTSPHGVTTQKANFDIFFFRFLKQVNVRKLHNFQTFITLQNFIVFIFEFVLMKQSLKM